LYLLFYRGENLTFLMYKDGQEYSQALEFFDGLPDSDKKKVMKTIQHIDIHKGRVWNEEKFKVIEGEKGRGRDQFYEIKVYKIRIGGVFEQGGRFILLYGFNKKANAWPTGELIRLHHMYESFDDRRKQ
jgi:Gp49-like protein DUF891